jgi:uncharacterized membrane protein
MFGFVVGSLCLYGLIKMHRMRRMAWAYGHGHQDACGGGPMFRRHGHHGHGPGFGHGPFGGRGFARGFGGPARGGLYGLYQALDATPGQEKVIRAAFDEVRTAVGEARGEWKQSRGDVAQAFRADSFDAEIMGNAFARHDEHLERVRKAVTGALAKVHDALDEKQRATLAEWLDSQRGPGFGMGPDFGPYR